MVTGIFTQEEIDFLKEFYPLYGPNYCAEKLNRVKKSLLNKTRNLKLKFRGVGCVFKYSKEGLSPIVKECFSLSDVLRKIGISCRGGSFKTLNKYILLYGLDTSHFNPKAIQLKALNNNSQFIKIPLKDILIEDSSYKSTSTLKHRLYNEGIKQRCCELCGQGEEWKGVQISLILDHKNGVSNDNRLENLRIVCPNCNAGLETHCRGHKGLKSYKEEKEEKKSLVKEDNFKQKVIKARKVERPTYEELKHLVELFGYKEIGRRFGVADNTIRKWLKTYEKHGY